MLTQPGSPGPGRALDLQPEPAGVPRPLSQLQVPPCRCVLWGRPGEIPPHPRRPGQPRWASPRKRGTPSSPQCPGELATLLTVWDCLGVAGRGVRMGEHDLLLRTRYVAPRQRDSWPKSHSVLRTALGDGHTVISSSKTGAYRWSSPPGTCWDPAGPRHVPEGTRRRERRGGGLKAPTGSPGTTAVWRATGWERCPCSHHHRLHCPLGPQDCPKLPRGSGTDSPLLCLGEACAGRGPLGPCFFHRSHKAHGVVARPQGGHLCESHLQTLKCRA